MGRGVRLLRHVRLLRRIRYLLLNLSNVDGIILTLQTYYAVHYSSITSIDKDDTSLFNFPLLSWLCFLNAGRSNFSDACAWSTFLCLIESIISGLFLNETILCDDLQVFGVDGCSRFSSLEKRGSLEIVFSLWSLCCPLVLCLCGQFGSLESMRLLVVPFGCVTSDDSFVSWYIDGRFSREAAWSPVES